MRIVLVEPSSIAQKMVTRLLEARDHDVRCFADGPEALAYLHSDHDVQALITSVELMSMSGYELCWEARLLSTYRQPIYILIMSSNYDRRKLVEALDSGADDYIGKPPAPEELYARLRAAERLAGMQQELVKLATVDPLSGALNRRAFFERAREACARAASGAALSAIMFDIDHFKRINDMHGHATGDVVIQRISEAAATESDTFARLGGEEFALLFEGRDLAQAVEIAERLRIRIGELRFDDPQLNATCSFGVGQWRDGDTIDRLLRRVDAALYRAKANGRNLVTADDDAAPENFPQAGRLVRSGRR
jgi:diguanylate cyclase (GGDEF)-like protein